MNESPLPRDHPIFSELAEDADLRDLLRSFVAILPEKVRGLQSLLIQRDRQALRQLAHQLNGTAGGYGFPTITAAAAKVELLARDGADWKAIAAASATLVDLIRRVDGYGKDGPAKERPAA